jgi:hypothetical protein
MLPPPKSLSTWTIHQEVFQNEPAFATMKRPAALAASKLLVRQSLIRFDTHLYCAPQFGRANGVASVTGMVLARA